MAPLPPAREFVPVPARGRTFEGSRPVRLGDVDGSARMRFDAIARHLQDIATDDAADTGLDGEMGWLVRRTLVSTSTSPRLGERLSLTTFCSGTGRSWAERRTSIRGSRGAEVEAVSLWVSIDPASGRPVTLGDRFHEIYGDAAGGRRVGARLVLTSPDELAADRGRWPIRAVDIDPYRHANNAAQWAAVEEMLGLDADRRGRAEIEFVGPIEPAESIRLLVGQGDPGRAGWLVETSEVVPAVRTAFFFTPHGGTE